MRATTTVAQMTVRITGLVQVVLGILFWTGNAVTFVPVHMLVGLILVLSLWTLAFLGARAAVPVGQVAVAFVWGLLVVLLGFTQDQILTGDAHWLVQVLHLLVGLAAIAMAEGLGVRIRQAPAAARA